MSTKTRLWVLVTGILCGLVVLYGILAGLLPQLSAAAQTRAEAEGTQLIIDTQKLQLTRLQIADRDSDQLSAELAELELAIPAGPNWPEFLRELQGIQSATGAIVSEVIVQPSILPVPAEAAPAPVEGDPAATDATATESAAPTDPAAATPVTVSNLIEIPITITVTGTPDQVAAFLRQLQVGERLFVAGEVSIDSTGEATNGIASGSIYVVP